MCPKEKYSINGEKKDLLPFPLLTEYLGYIEAIQGRSPLTVKEYGYDLILFFRFMIRNRGGQKDKPFRQIDISQVDIEFLRSVRLSDCYAFLSWLARERNSSAANRARKVATLRSFFSFLKTKKGVIDEDPTYELESPKKTKKQPRYLTLDESERLLDKIDSSDSKFSERDYCIVTLFLNCGMRLSELCGINLKDISGETLRVLGKGGKERTVYLNGACLDALEAYLKVRPKRGIKATDKDALFISRQGNRISGSAVQRLIKQYIRQSGLDPARYSTHKLRHTAATLMYKYGQVDIRRLQQILGHSSVSTTEIYTHVDSAGLHDAVEKNPLASVRRLRQNADNTREEVGTEETDHYLESKS